MMHLTAEQLIDAVEGRLAGDLAGHLDRCAACQEGAASLRSVLEDVHATASLPEPSPLFWEHFSRRVRAATEVERVPASPAWWQHVWRPLVAVTAVAGAVALAVVMRSGPESAFMPSTPVVATADAVPTDDLSADVVTAVAGDLSFDELREGDMVPSRRAVDLAVSQLTESQQRELMRLVREEFTGSE
jgi:hypothetical protein